MKRTGLRCNGLTLSNLAVCISRARCERVSVADVHAGPPWWPWQQPIRLGLDLRGGTHLLYSVDIEQAIANGVERQRQDLERELREAQVGTIKVDRDQLTLRVQLGNLEKRTEVTDVVRRRFPEISASPRVPSRRVRR